MAKMIVHEDVVFLKTTPFKSKNPPIPNAGRRGAITRFSRKSRKRMIETLAKYRPDAGAAYFVTLTYPGHFTHTPAEVKYHIALFRKAVMYHYPNAGALWRIEIKPRLSGESIGEFVPHYHLLLYGTGQNWEAVRDFVSSKWNAIVSPDDEAHLKACANVRIVDSRKHAYFYVSKYAAKRDDDGNSGAWGRIWGTFGHWDTSPYAVIEVPDEIVIPLKRMIARWMKARGGKYYRRFSRQAPKFSFSALGLGACSHRLFKAQKSPPTIERMAGFLGIKLALLY